MELKRKEKVERETDETTKVVYVGTVTLIMITHDDGNDNNS